MQANTGTGIPPVTGAGPVPPSHSSPNMSVISAQLLGVLRQMQLKGLSVDDRRVKTVLAIKKFCAIQQGDAPPQLALFTPEQHEQFLHQLQAYMSLSKQEPIPMELVQKLNIPAHLHGVSQNIKYPPPADPTEVSWKLAIMNKTDPKVWWELRENQVQQRMKRRLQEAEPNSKDARMLRLLPLQKKLRMALVDNVIMTAQTELTEKNARKKGEKALLAKMKKKRDTTRRKKRIELENHYRYKKQTFMRELMSHSRDFWSFHRENARSLRRIAVAASKHLVERDKEEKTEGGKAERARLQALRERDEDAYMELVKQTKNARLMELLQQTEQYMEKLGAKIIQQRETELAAEAHNKGGGEYDNDRQAASNVATETPVSELNAHPDLKKSKERYYKLAHAVTEEVLEQPKALVAGELREYQVAGLQWMVSLYNNNLNGILADEMGLGKTVQTVSLIAYLMEKKGNKGPHLIVAPLSTLRNNWLSEFDRWLPDVVKVVYDGNKETRRQMRERQMGAGQFHVLLTTFEYIMKDKKYLRKIRWEYIIVDEAHRLKNPKSKLAQDLNKHYQCRRRLALTGTPLQNDLQEVWALLNFLHPGIFNSADNFELWFNASFSGGDKLEVTEEEKLLIIDRLHKVLRPFVLRREKREVESQLPEKTEKLVRCELSGMQKAMYEQIMRGSLGNLSIQNVMMQLRKVCNHPYIFDKSNCFPIDENLVRCCGKFELLDRILPKLKKAGHRVLMFSQMTHLLNLLESYFHLRGYRYLRLDGHTATEKRAQLLQQFNAPNSPYFIFILSTKAGGLGLNLQSADTVIIFDSDWNPQNDEQASSRAHRIGQKQHVLVLRLVSSGTVEEKILSTATNKLDQENLIIKAGMFNEKNNATERREKLTELLRNIERSYEDDIPDDYQLNCIVARTDEELHLFEKMDRDKEKQEKEKWAKTGNSDIMPHRLMQERIIPEWLVGHKKKSKNTMEMDAALEYGRGRRVKEDVTYGDNLTEKEWTKIIDEGGDVAAYIRKKKERRSHKDDEIQIEEEDEDAMEKETEKEQEATEEKKRKKPKVDVTPFKPSAPKNESLAKRLALICHNLESAKDSRGRIAVTQFLELPSRRDNPQYYELCLDPISFKHIKEKVDHFEYTSLIDFEDDVKRMISNARTYGDTDNTSIYQDSMYLEHVLKREMAKQTGEEDITSSSEEDEEEVVFEEVTEAERNRKLHDEEDEEEEDEEDEEEDDEEEDIRGAHEHDDEEEDNRRLLSRSIRRDAHEEEEEEEEDDEELAEEDSMMVDEDADLDQTLASMDVEDIEKAIGLQDGGEEEAEDDEGEGEEGEATAYHLSGQFRDDLDDEELMRDDSVEGSDEEDE